MSQTGFDPNTKDDFFLYRKWITKEELEKQREINMDMVDVEETKNICNWLIGHGLSLSEAACVAGYVKTGDNFSTAILKVLISRKECNEKTYYRNEDGTYPHLEPVIRPKTCEEPHNHSQSNHLPQSPSEGQTPNT